MFLDYYQNLSDVIHTMQKNYYSCVQIKCLQLKITNFHAGCFKQLLLLSSLIIINLYHFILSRAVSAVFDTSYLGWFIYLFILRNIVIKKPGRPKKVLINHKVLSNVKAGPC